VKSMEKMISISKANKT